jgi:uncharacterized protein YeaO (DUF488 family)
VELMASCPVTIRRAYDVAGSAPPAAGPARVLVDRLWPRGVRKEALQLTEWMRDVAPSTELRRWYGHEPERWERFRERYLEELETPDRGPDLGRLRALAAEQGVELITATKDVPRSGACVLADHLRGD